MKIEALGYVLTLERADTIENELEREAKALRNDFRTGFKDKIPAIKAVRELFQGTADKRQWLKEAKEYIES